MKYYLSFVTRTREAIQLPLPSPCWSLSQVLSQKALPQQGKASTALGHANLLLEKPLYAPVSGAGAGLTHKCDTSLWDRPSRRGRQRLSEPPVCLLFHISHSKSGASELTQIPHGNKADISSHLYVINKFLFKNMLSLIHSFKSEKDNTIIDQFKQS